VRVGERPRTENLGENGPERRRVYARPPAEAKDVRGVAIAGLPDGQGLRALARGTVAAPLRPRLLESERRGHALRAAVAVAREDQGRHGTKRRGAFPVVPGERSVSRRLRQIRVEALDQGFDPGETLIHLSESTLHL